MRLTRRQFVARSSMAALLPRRGSAQTAPAPGAAMDALTAAIPRAEADPDRPIYHFRPPANWNNDPQPFVWTKSADEILERLASYLHRIPGAGH